MISRNPVSRISVSPTSMSDRLGDRDSEAARRGGEELRGARGNGLRGKADDRDAVHPVDEVGEQSPSAEEKLEAQVEEEAHVTKPLPTPETPTRSEVLSHNVTHVPYRPWCKHCVEGRDREFGHSTCDRGSHGTPIVSFDYCYIGDKGEIITKEEFEDAGPGIVHRKCF